MIPTAMLRVGSRFGNYEIERLIDHGGMGYVYLVRHPVLHVERALKVLDPRKVGEKDEFVERFNREAQLVCRIHHPNLVEVFDAGLDQATGLRYIVMEYVPGGTLKDRLKKCGRLPWREALSIVRQTAEALSAVARRGSVHRDIKPANIMFAADGTVRLADFGIAKAAVDDAEDTLETRDGQVFGTPAYMSPEQFRSASSVDVRADIWSLGVVLFEALVGRRPYVSDSSMGLLASLLSDSPIPDVRLARLGEGSVSPDSTETTLPTLATGETVATVAVADDLPAAVARLVADMCEKSLSRRLASPDAVISRIDAILPPPASVSVPVSRRAPASRSPQTADAVRRNSRRPLVALFAILALAAIGIALFLVQGREGERPSRVTAPKVETPKVEAVKPKVEAVKPNVEAPKPKVEAAKPNVEAAKPNVEAAKPKVEVPVSRSKVAAPDPIAAGGTVCIGVRMEGAAYRPANGMGVLWRSVSEAIAAHAGLVVLAPAEECVRARVSLNGYSLKVAEVCDRLREVGIACRYRRSGDAAEKIRPYDEAAVKACSMRSVPID